MQKHNTMNASKKYGGLKEYSLAEVAKHCTKDDCWIVIQGYVFEVTEYIPYHPGGEHILKAAGKDGTTYYTNIHPWINLGSLMKNCCVGRLSKFVAPQSNSQTQAEAKTSVNEKSEHVTKTEATASTPHSQNQENSEKDAMVPLSSKDKNEEKEKEKEEEEEEDNEDASKSNTSANDKQ
ncbi:hypothetical protein RFI_28790 [Reticulomyxa filosa]|uniref:Cytochrome b5 heme-binding domain-containing protein n=1 Tax=Reticulomyxa filosa TaxID=46433 RepID=X6M554_RETFI|nr:hypothetical protein RFI_28790 [Reticulomyxa filosa]|eukprot:ETO08597.1 hypothetical protein RFI_28790 [Reticulomyxa filosa]